MTTRPPADGSAPGPDAEQGDGVTPPPPAAASVPPPGLPTGTTEPASPLDPTPPTTATTDADTWAPPVPPADPFLAPPAEPPGAPHPDPFLAPPPDPHPAPPGAFPPPATAFPPPTGAFPPPSTAFPPPTGGYPGPYPSGQQPFPPDPPRDNRRPLLIGGAVLAAAAMVGGAFLLLGNDEPDLQWQGEGIDEPEATLDAAEQALAELVEDRHGALHDDGRCYFSLPGDETVKDVNEYVRCGPVLFVDGDPDEPYLSYPLSLSDEGGTTLVVGDRPVTPEPTALDMGERLSRPDGAAAPDGNGGLEAPDPPPAAEDVLGAIDVGASTVGTPPEGAKIGALNASYELTALGTIDRYGRGDDARSPADGHQLIAFKVSTGPGETPAPTASPTVQVQVDDGEPRDVGTIIDGSSPVVMSVPDDAASVDLVVTDAETEQRLSLLDGTPGDGNIQVLTRANREQTLGTVHEVSATGRDGSGSASVTGTITVRAVYLDWFLYDDPSKRPSTPQTAYLVLELEYAWVGVEPVDAGLSHQPFSVVLPDGQVLPATNLAPDPTSGVIVAIEVPADFTTGTLQIGGVDQQATGLTIDFGGNVYSTPLSIAAG